MTRQPIKILFVGQKPYTAAKGGIGSYINHRAYLLSEHGFEVWWSDEHEYAHFDSDAKKWGKVMAIEDRKFIYKLLSNFYFRYSAVWINALNNIKPDITEIPDGITTLLPGRRKSKFIIQCHTSWLLRNFLNNKKPGFLAKRTTRMRAAIQKRIFKNADAVVAPSHEILFLESGFLRLHPDRFTVLNHFFSVDVEDGSKDSGKKDGQFFLVVGNFEYLKGFDLILKAFQKYRESGGRYDLVFAGNEGWRDKLFVSEWGDSEDIANFRESAAVGHVRFLGTISKDKLADIRSRSVAVIVGSRYETFTMVAGECYLNNTPLILSDRTGWARLALKHNSAMVISPYDTKSFSQAMAMFEDEDLIKKLMPGIERTAQYISGDELKKDTINFYESI